MSIVSYEQFKENAVNEHTIGNRSKAAYSSSKKAYTSTTATSIGVLVPQTYPVKGNIALSANYKILSIVDLSTCKAKIL